MSNQQQVTKSRFKFWDYGPTMRSVWKHLERISWLPFCVNRIGTISWEYLSTAQGNSLSRMGLKDSSEAVNVVTEESVAGEVLFSKRSRGNKTRKRVRSSGHDEETSARNHVESPRTKETKREDVTQWTREKFDSTHKAVPHKSQATAERLDIGGDTNTTSAPATKKPFGPLSAPSHLRTSVRVDYQPDVCKDYKETGYCGFGDSCKFLHDRSDYKAGWQLDKEWAQTEKMAKDRILRGEDPLTAGSKKNLKDRDDDGLPFACFICRNDFRRPVLTLCGHYFCEDCILEKMVATSVCPVCKKPLRGTLNPAPRLVKQLKDR